MQTLRGHEHVIETLCFGKKPTDAAALMAAAAHSEAGKLKNGENGVDSAKDTQVL